MAAWCLMTGQPVSAYMSLDRVQRDAFQRVAKRINDKRKARRVRRRRG